MRGRSRDARFPKKVGRNISPGPAALLGKPAVAPKKTAYAPLSQQWQPKDRLHTAGQASSGSQKTACTRLGKPAVAPKTACTLLGKPAVARKKTADTSPLPL
jgi:hypothetical protein